MYVLLVTKMGWATFWAIYSQPRLVTLIIPELRSVKTSKPSARIGAKKIVFEFKFHQRVRFLGKKHVFRETGF
jgi:hypothetical protein